MAGNETNFFVRDATNGSTLPLRIRPGAPTSAIDIAANGDVGVGTDSPEASVHVKRTDGSAGLFIEEVSSTVATRNLLELENNGVPRLKMRNANTDSTWFTEVTKRGEYSIRQKNTVEFKLDASGNLEIIGTLRQGSDRASKEHFAPVDGSEILARLAELSITSWNYRRDDDSVRHIGPTAQDFRAAFGLGHDNVTLAPVDVEGVSLAAIKELHRGLLEREAEVTALEARLVTMENAIAALAGQRMSE